MELQRRKVEFICKTVAAPYHVAGSLLTARIVDRFVVCDLENDHYE